MTVIRLPRGLSPAARLVLSEALSRGWTFHVTKKGHLRLLHPDGVHSTLIGPNLHAANRGLQNALAAIRRYPVARPTPTTEETPVSTTTTPLGLPVEETTPEPAPKPKPAPKAKPIKAPAVIVTKPPVRPFEWVKGGHSEYLVTDGTTITCMAPGCEFTRPDDGNKRGIHLHERVHTGAAAANGAAVSGRRSERRRAAVRGVADLIAYFDGELPAPAELAKVKAENERLRARVGDLEAKLALVSEAMRA